MANPRGFLDAAGDGPLTFGQRLAGDPRIARVIEGNLPALSQIDPQLAARLQQRDPEAIFEAYQMIVGSGGRLKAPAKPEPFSAVDAPARQMDLPISDDPVESIRSLIPYGSRGPGVAVGGPTGSGVPVGEPSGPGVLQFPPPSASRLGPTGVIPHPSMGGPRDLIAVPPPGARGLRDAAAAGIAGAAAGAGGYLAGDRLAQELLLEPDDSVDMKSGDTAALAAESSPPPSVIAASGPPPASLGAEKSAILSQRNWDTHGNELPLATDAQLDEWRDMDVAAGRMPPRPQRKPAAVVPPELRGEWQDYENQLDMRAGDSVWNPPTFAQASRRRLMDDINEQRRENGLPPMSAPRRPAAASSFDPNAASQINVDPAPATQMSPQESMEADLYAKGYSADEARKQAALQAELQAEREAKQLEQDLSQGGYGQRRVPGPRDLSGRAPMGAPFASVEEGRGYSERAVDEAGRPVMSQRDRDMRERGFIPVQTPDGTTAYQLEYLDGRSVGPGQQGYRKGLVDSGKYEYAEVPGMGGAGKSRVLTPTKAFREQMVEQNARVKAAQDKRNPYKNLASPADRMSRFLAQIQLGGGRLSPQAIQLETMLNGMDPEQRQRSLQYMAPGGALAAQVDARNLEAAAGLARNAVMGVLGQAGANNPAAAAAIESGLPLDQQVQLTRDRNGGTLPANSPAGVALLQQIENDVIGPFATEAEVDQAVRQAVAAGIPLADAEAHFAPRRWKKKPAPDTEEPSPVPTAGAPLPPLPGP